MSQMGVFFDDEVESIMGIVNKTITTPNSSVGSMASTEPRRIPNKGAHLFGGYDEHYEDSVISSDEELCNERRYEWATWQMYIRIKAARVSRYAAAVSTASATTPAITPVDDVQIHVRARNKPKTFDTNVYQNIAPVPACNEDHNHPEVFHIEI